MVKSIKFKVEDVINVYRLLTDVIFEISANRLSVAKNMLGSAASDLKSSLRSVGVNVPTTTKDDPFTVVGYYEDNSQIFCEHVMATDSNDAVKQLIKKIEEKRGVVNPDGQKGIRNGICIVEIFRGHHESLNDCSTLSCAFDWPGLGVKDE